MRVLIAIRSCHLLRERREAIRETWLPGVAETPFDCRFFVGESIESWPQKPPLEPDVVELKCRDDYRGLPAKAQCICRWALEQGYDWVFMMDDDVYLQPARLYNSDFAQLGAHYVGRKRGPSGGRPAPYASGFSYWLSARAMKVLANRTLTDDPAEDREAGNALLEAGLPCIGDYRYVVTDSARSAVSHSEGPRKGNTVISACEFTPPAMRRIHQEWLTLRAKEPRKRTDKLPFYKVCVLVKTFLRDGYLLKCVEGIEKTMPGAKIVVVDDGDESHFKISWYAELRSRGHEVLWLPFDSGFGAKANAGVKACDREYVLIASDDFNFDNPAAAAGVAKLQTVLDADHRFQVASGRVAGRPYEALLRVEGRDCYETRGTRAKFKAGEVVYHDCDLTVNYSLIRREVFEKVGWDGGEVKIGGGEHGAFYLDLMREGFKVCWVEGVEVHELQGSTDWTTGTYMKYRNRARTPGRPCLKKRGIDRWHGMGGGVEEA